MVNDIRANIDKNIPSALVLLDSNAAFNTVDHEILLNRLRYQIGLCRIAFTWFKSYLSEIKLCQCKFVSVKDNSNKHDLTCGVPQGYILGPLLFNLYMLPPRSVIR